MIRYGMVRFLTTSSPCQRCSTNLIQLKSSAELLRCYSSKTAVNKSSLAASPKGERTSPYEIESQGGIKLESLDKNESSVPAVMRKRRKKAILRMDESELEGYALLTQKMPLLDRRGETQSHYLRAFAPEKRNSADMLALMHGDYDFRPAAIKRWWSSMEAEGEIKNQAYNPKRNSILGNDLAAAHFVVFRRGKVRFMNKVDWIDTYRIDSKVTDKEEDLPVMSFKLCSLPVNYDPTYRVEAIDVSGMTLRYEGLLNFQNLNYVKWLSFKDAPLIDDWCMDRIVRIFHATLEYIDLSGCSKVTDKGIGTLSRCKHLKTLIVENMPHVKDLEIVCALLEDHNPCLTVFGVDYIQKTEQLRKEGDELERKVKEEEAALEANTITVEPKHGPGPDPFRSSVDTETNYSAKSL